jgi:hypothetical protein
VQPGQVSSGVGDRVLGIGFAEGNGGVLDESCSMAAWKGRSSWAGR